MLQSFGERIVDMLQIECFGNKFNIKILLFYNKIKYGKRKKY